MENILAGLRQQAARNAGRQVEPTIHQLEAKGYDTARHTPQRLTAAEKLCARHWKTDRPAFFVGGGGQCDVYGFYAAENTVLYAKHPSVDAGEEMSDSLNSMREWASPPRTEKICLRIPRATVSDEQKKKLIEEEVHWRNLLKKHNINGVQLMITHDVTFDNELGSPYIALEWAEGKQLKWNDNTPAKAEDREKVIRQIVEMQLAMLRIQTAGEGARMYMQNLIDNQIRYISQPGPHRNERPMGQSAQQHMDQFIKAIMTLYGNSPIRMQQVQQDLLDRHIIAELEGAPHVLVHGDLGEGNIIIDENHNVTLIDLGYMHQEPLQLAAYFPRFLTHEPSSVAADEPFDRRMEVVGWVRGWGQTDSVQEAKDRKYYMDYVKAVAEGGLDEPYAKVDERLRHWTKIYSDVLHREDEVERFWWMQAMQRVDVWLEMERCDWKPREGKKKDVDVDGEMTAGPLGKPLGFLSRGEDMDTELETREELEYRGELPHEKR